MEHLFTFLFKYRPTAFARGDVVFDPPAAWWLIAIAGGAAAAFAVLAYRRADQLPVRDRIVLTSLRALALGVLVACLAGPVLLVATAVPQRNAVAVLLDDSRSMSITDAGGDRTRFAAALEQFAPDTGALTARLAERFQVRVFTFSEALRALSDQPGAPAGRVTDLAGALSAARDRLADGTPLAGVVVVSDGGDNAGGVLTDVVLRYRAAGIPVHTVGVGAERFDRDIAVEPAVIPERALRHSTVVVEVRLTHRGFGGTTVPVLVEDDGAIVGRTEVRLPRDGDAVTVPVGFPVATAGPRRLRILVPLQSGERVAENNVREALLSVEDRAQRILHVEGEPRPELKFLRRAVADDEQVQLVTLLRSARDKYLRLGVSDSTELIAGFPRTREELFAYSGLVLGSIEASVFTRDQLRMLADFVRVRGGGLLVLGGRHAFTTGGWAGTPLAEALPVDLPREADTSFFQLMQVRPTPAGRRSALARLDADDATDRRRWDSLPPLAAVHAIRTAKPGAAVLLEGTTERGEPIVVLATQRYGRGRAAALNVIDLWQWQMAATIAVDDQTHETLSRQMLRWLVGDTPDPVAVRPAATRVLAGRGVDLVADVTDSAYAALNGADVTARVRAADGTETMVPLTWSVERDGEYHGRFTPPTDGLYAVTVEARSGGRPVGTAPAFIDAGDPRLEFSAAERQTALLRRIAEETGGRSYALDDAAGLPEDVRFTAAGTTTHERLDLWDMPAVLFALLLLIGAEWGYRRVRGLA